MVDAIQTFNTVGVPRRDGRFFCARKFGVGPLLEVLPVVRRMQVLGKLIAQALASQPATHLIQATPRIPMIWVTEQYRQLMLQGVASTTAK